MLVSEYILKTLLLLHNLSGENDFDVFDVSVHRSICLKHKSCCSLRNVLYKLRNYIVKLSVLS